MADDQAPINWSELRQSAVILERFARPLTGVLTLIDAAQRADQHARDLVGSAEQVVGELRRQATELAARNNAFQAEMQGKTERATRELAELERSVSSRRTALEADITAVEARWQHAVDQMQGAEAAARTKGEELDRAHQVRADALEAAHAARAGELAGQIAALQERVEQVNRQLEAAKARVLKV